mmetsp:Transcript_21477/g.35442  ORF Transcript_21477/g.35442 Transcript_21477/m.35442 type:complete len:81 (-) Transcript_21477:4686-4928(-)
MANIKRQGLLARRRSANKGRIDVGIYVSINGIKFVNSSQHSEEGACGMRMHTCANGIAPLTERSQDLARPNLSRWRDEQP